MGSSTPRAAGATEDSLLGRLLITSITNRNQDA